MASKCLVVSVHLSLVLLFRAIVSCFFLSFRSLLQSSDCICLYFFDTIVAVFVVLVNLVNTLKLGPVFIIVSTF